MTARDSDSKSVQEKTSGSSKIHWDDTKMKTSYANVCNAFSTREEFTLLFGTNQTLHSDQKGINVNLDNRIILSPYAAKRLTVLLSNVLDEYEKRFGPLDVEKKP